MTRKIMMLPARVPHDMPPVLMSKEIVWEGVARVPTGARVPSGHWWVYVSAPGERGVGEGAVTVNGDTLLFPVNTWFVCENHRCMALRHSSLAMFWLDGDVLWAKVIGKYGAVHEKRVGEDGPCE